MTQNDARFTSPVLLVRTALRRALPVYPLLMLAVLLTSFPARADEEDDRYLRIVELIQRADSLAGKNQPASALAKYREAETNLLRFAQLDRDWNPQIVGYRLKYLSEKIEALSEKPAAPANGSAVAGTATGELQVKLIDAGSEPRKLLRLHPKVGDKQTLTMQIKIGMEMKIAGMENPGMKLPGMVMTMETTVQDVSSEGDIKYETVMTDGVIAPEPGALPQVVEAMKTSFAGLKGLSGTGTVTSQGINKGTDIKAPPGADPQLQQAMDQMKQSFAALANPLPNEAVGPGAKWESKAPIKSQGMTIEQAISYELVSIDGDQMVARMTIAQTAANQKIQNPAMPGLKMDLTRMTGKGTGEFTLDLARLLPQKANVDSHSEFTMGMNAGGQKQTMSMNMDVAMQVESK